MGKNRHAPFPNPLTDTKLGKHKQSHPVKRNRKNARDERKKGGVGCKKKETGKKAYKQSRKMTQ